MAEGVVQGGQVLPVVSDCDAEATREGRCDGFAGEDGGGFEDGLSGEGGLIDPAAAVTNDVATIIKEEGGGLGEGGEDAGDVGDVGTIEFGLIDGAEVLEDADFGGLPAGGLQGGHAVWKSADEDEDAEDEDGHGEEDLGQGEGGGEAAMPRDGGCEMHVRG